MKKILAFLILITNISFGQRTGYGYQSSGSYSKTYEENERIKCDDAVKLVESKGRYLAVSFGGYRSDVIEKIRWYEYNDILYSIVFFKNKIYKGYLYGGWKYNFNDYYSIKKAFEASESKGDFFWKYIEKAKIECD